MIWKETVIPDRVIVAVLDRAAHDIRQAIQYVSPTCVVTATRRHQPDRRARTAEVVVTIGAPNSRARVFIKAAQRAGEPFPIKKIQLRFWPMKARKAA